MTRPVVVGSLVVAVNDEDRPHPIDGLAGAAVERVVAVACAVICVAGRGQPLLLVEAVAGCSELIRISDDWYEFGCGDRI